MALKNKFLIVLTFPICILHLRLHTFIYYIITDTKNTYFPHLHFSVFAPWAIYIHVYYTITDTENTCSYFPHLHFSVFAP